MRLVNERSPCTDAKATQKHPDQNVLGTKPQDGVESGNGDLDDSSIEKDGTKLEGRAEILHISNLKEFSRYPNAHSMVWDHLFEEDAMSHDHVESSHEGSSLHYRRRKFHLQKSSFRDAPQFPRHVQFLLMDSASKNKSGQSTIKAAHNWKGLRDWRSRGSVKCKYATQEE